MRATRFLLAALALSLAAACTAEPVGVVQPDENPSLDGVGMSGSGDAVASDTTVSQRGVGFVGSNN